MLPGIAGLAGRAGGQVLAAFDPAASAGYVANGSDTLAEENRRATVIGSQWARNVAKPFAGNSVIAVVLTAATNSGSLDGVGFGVTALTSPYAYPGNNNFGDSGYGFYANGASYWYAMSPDQSFKGGTSEPMINVPVGFAFHAASKNLYMTLNGVAFYDIKAEMKTVAQVAAGDGTGPTGYFTPPARFAAGLRTGQGPSTARIVAYPWALPPGFVEHS